MIEVIITGPGLLVNEPALVVYQALRDAGYNVSMPTWAGADEPLPEWKQQLQVAVTVRPMPWGG